VTVAGGEGGRVRARGDSRERHWGRSWVRLWQLLRPPVSDPKFWATQGLVVVIAGVHDFVELTGLIEGLGMAYLLPISFFFIPVIYAALFFGLRGALATALWCTVLTVPNWLFVHDGTTRLGSVSQMVIINLIAIFVGSRVDAQMKAAQALQLSETKYRGLFDTAGEGILVLDLARRIAECNTAAASLLRGSVESLRGKRLDEVLGGKGASALLAGVDNSRNGPGAAVPLESPPGEQVWVEPVANPLAGQEGLTQIVLRNVSDQRRRQTELASYSAQIVRAQEEERQRLAQELHDETIQSLLLLCRMLDDSDVTPGAEAADSATVLRDAHGYAQSLVASVRALASGLRPSLLDDLGLSSALDTILTDVASRCSIRGKLIIRGPERRLPTEVELALFRIGQEALHNVERHSDASQINVTLRYRPGKTQLLVADDGKGFIVPETTAELSKRNKLGLIGMQERARIAGGTFVIESTPGMGTRIVVEVTDAPHEAYARA